MDISSLSAGLPGGTIDGGTVSNHSAKPVEIKSKDIIYFNAESSFSSLAVQFDYSFVGVYAAKADAGILVSLTCSTGRPFTGEINTESSFALVENSVLDELQKIVEKYNYAAKNGQSHYVNGLPQNFGGNVTVEYASGEKISFDDNQSPVISTESAAEFIGVLKHYMTKKRVKIPGTDNIVAVRYQRETDDNNYSRLFLDDKKIISDNNYGGEDKHWIKEYTVSGEALEKIRSIAETYALPAWTGIPEYDRSFYGGTDERLVFSLKNGGEFSVTDRMRKPSRAEGIIFDIKSFIQSFI